MSSDPPKADTRQRILGAALKLMREGAAGASLVQIAKAAGVSRQAVYLHFADRADLYLALVRHVDESRDLAGALRRIEQAPTGVGALLEAVAISSADEPGSLPGGVSD